MNATFPRTIVARGPDGEVLVTIWPDGVEVATRSEPGDVWSPPLTVVSDEGAS